MKVGFLGTPEHSAILLDNLIKAGIEISYTITNPDKPSGRGGLLTPTPVKKKSLEYSIPYFQDSIKSEMAFEFISKYQSDLQLVFAYGSLIPDNIINFPQMGTLNLHGSLLPEYRGASPVQSAIMDGKKQSGFSLQYIVKELDAGDIVLVHSMEITSIDTYGTFLDRMTDLASQKIIELIKNHKSLERFHSIPQDHSKATYCKKIPKESRKLDFSEDSFMLHNKIRAFNPWDYCYAFFREKRILILSSEIFDGNIEGVVGSYYRLDKKIGGIVTKDQKLLIIKELQPENKKKMTIADFINGFRPIQGEMFL
jgi:methionyl-tRNA formyltransferase